MPNHYEVVAITDAVEFTVVGDRLRFTLVSGDCRRSYAMPFHAARAAACDTLRLLDAVDRRRGVVAFKTG